MARRIAGLRSSFDPRFLIATVALLEIHLNAAETILTHFLTATKPHIPAFSPLCSWPPADTKCDPRALSKVSASGLNRLESKKKWQSPLKPFALNQSPVKISSTP